MNISVAIGSAVFQNPVTVASGTFGQAQKFHDLEEVKTLGAIVPKTVTLGPQAGNSPVRIQETPCGMINAIGIENPGIDLFITKHLPVLAKIGVPLIVSVLGKTPQQFLEIIAKLNGQPSVAAVELNLSCPNLKHKTLIAQDPDATQALVRQVKSMTRFPVIAKLSPNVTDIAEIAQAAQDAGADAVSLVNTWTAMSIDVERRCSRIGSLTGGLSGPAIRPIAVAMTHRVYRHVRIPIIGMGGITCANDALEFIIAGASMVAVGTFNFVNPRAVLDVLGGIKDYMARHKIEDFKELIGSLSDEQK